MQNINFITYSNLNQIIVKNLYKIPHDIDLVVGVPRSGLIPANIISCYLHKPLTDVENFLAGRIFGAGSTKNKSDWIQNAASAKKVLIVEDSTNTGTSILSVMKKLENINIEKIYFSVIVAPNAIKMVDLFFAVVPQPRVFEWNYMHHVFLKNFCLDLDGVLCQDPTPEQNDDGIQYQKFCLNAVPKFIPSRKIGYIVTSRLKKYSTETQIWLLKNNIDYEKLIMLDLESAEERRRLNIHAKFKAHIYSQINNAILFVESEPQQAADIAQMTNKPVFCTGNSMFFPANGGGQVIKISWRAKKWLLQYFRRREQVEEWAKARTKFFWNFWAKQF